MRPSATSMSSVSPFPSMRRRKRLCRPCGRWRSPAAGYAPGSVRRPVRPHCRARTPGVRGNSGTGREGFAHLLQGHPPLSEQPLGMEEQVAGQLLKPQFLCREVTSTLSRSCRAALSSHASIVSIRSTSHPATAVGVLSAVCATMSATLVSFVMADTRQHRQRELRHVGAEPVGIEAVEVVGRTAAADDDHGVELLHAVGHGAQRRDDRFLGRRTLHERIEERETEPVGAFADLLAEILVAGGIGARNDGYALYDGGHPDLAVHVPHAPPCADSRWSAAAAAACRPACRQGRCR